MEKKLRTIALDDFLHLKSSGCTQVSSKEPIANPCVLRTVSDRIYFGRRIFMASPLRGALCHLHMSLQAGKYITIQPQPQADLPIEQ